MLAGADVRVTFSDGTFDGRMLSRGDGDAEGVVDAEGVGVGDAVGDADGVAESDDVGDTAAETWLPAPQAVARSRSVALARALMRPA